MLSPSGRSKEAEKCTCFEQKSPFLSGACFVSWLIRPKLKRVPGVFLNLILRRSLCHPFILLLAILGVKVNTGVVLISL